MASPDSLPRFPPVQQNKDVGCAVSRPVAVVPWSYTADDWKMILALLAVIALAVILAKASKN
jgi:hypothetical protein